MAVVPSIVRKPPKGVKLKEVLEMKIINLTPHDIVVRTENGDITFPKSGDVARVTTQSMVTGEVNGITVVRTVFGTVEIPAQAEGIMYLVSAMVLSALAGTRGDVVAPDTGTTAVRNEKGQIIAVTRFTI